FTAILMGHYIPVTWLTFGLDYTLWGLDPRGYHLTNVLLHAANAAVFFLIARRLLGRALAVEGLLLNACASAATLFFALHPLRAESVAWATERRDVLSGLFTLTTVVLYLRAAEAEGRRRIRLLAAAGLTYLLALGSKSIVMTLPLALVLLDVYPLRRLPASWRRWADVAYRDVWREKIPFFALAGVGAIVSWYAVAANDFFTPTEKYPIAARVGFVFYSLAFYVSKTVLPVGLTPLYELPPRVDLLAPAFATAITVVVAGWAGLLALRRRWPAGLAAAAYYAIAIAPVSGFVHAGHQLAHDRYSYLSCLGFALLVGALPATVVRLRRQRAIQPTLAGVAHAGIVAWLGALAVLTVLQVQVWRDTDTLWRYAIDADDHCSVCHHNLGFNLLFVEQVPAHAIPHLERALELRPDRVKLNTTLGIAYARSGAPERALPHFEKVLADKPASIDVLVHQALALADAGRLREAHAVLRRAMSIHASDPVVLTNLGNILTRLGRAEEALGHLWRAVELAPAAGPPRLGLGISLLALGRTDDAREQYDALVAMKTPDAPALARSLAARLIVEW
ncbi:MAG TPA: tetratricopeptide repeat protein, partial [Solirubrobacterales bacterium]|nr:tetratricopeptide repeat protein [Solirubrobacterales bacterium]